MRARSIGPAISACRAPPARGPAASRSRRSTSSCAAGWARTRRSASRLLRRVPSPLVEDYVSRLFADLPRAARARRNVHALLRAHSRRRFDFDRKWKRNRRRGRRLNQGIAPKDFVMAAGPNQRKPKSPTESYHGRARGGRSRGRARRQGAAGSPGVGDRSVRQGAGDLLQLPGRRLRADRHGAQDRSAASASSRSTPAGCRKRPTT